MLKRPRTILALIAFALLGLTGCVAYPVDGYYAGGPAYGYAPPPSAYFGGSVGTYRPQRNWGHPNRGYRHQGHRHGRWR